MKKGRLVLLLTIISLLAFVVTIPIGITTSLFLIGRCVLYLVEYHQPMDYVAYIGVASGQLIPLTINALTLLVSPIFLLVALVLLLIMNKKDKTVIPSYALVGVSMVTLLVAHLSTLLGASGFGVILFNHNTFYNGHGYTFRLFELFQYYTWDLTLLVNLLYIIIYLVLFAYALIPVLLFVISIILGIVQKIQDKKALKQQEVVEEEPATEEQPVEEDNDRLHRLKELLDKGAITQEEYDKLKEEQPAE